MLQVHLTKGAEKDYRKIDKRYQKKILAMLTILESEPYFGGKMSGNFQGFYRVKIPPLRIIYTIDLAGKIVWVKAIGHRGDIYK